MSVCVAGACVSVEVVDAEGKRGKESRHGLEERERDSTNAGQCGKKQGMDSDMGAARALTGVACPCGGKQRDGQTRQNADEASSLIPL